MHFSTQLNAAEALDYLQDASEGRKLAVLASTGDSSGFSMMELLAGGVPFLATSTGGAVEMVAEADQQGVLVKPTAGQLLGRIKQVGRA